jgi:hypothetical protein
MIPQLLDLEVHFAIKSTILSKNACLSFLSRLVADLCALIRIWCRTHMSIDAFGIVTFGTMITRCHTCNKAKRLKLAFLWAVVMSMATLGVIRTRATQVEDIAQLHLLNAVDLFFVVLLGWRIDARAQMRAQNALIVACGWWDVL